MIDAGGKALTLERFERHVNPARVAVLQALGMDLVAARSEGYRVWDFEGREFLDLDLRAGVYNLGHRNPEIVSALLHALERSDMGFALFPGQHQAALAEKLATSAQLWNVLFAASGTEANDMAIQVARRCTGRRRVLSCASGYHGATGLSSVAGNPAFAEKFNSDSPGEFATFPLNGLEALEHELRKDDVAAVIIESSCNAAGYPETTPSFWSDLRALCDKHGTALVLDEIVTGLGRSGQAWGFQKVGVKPDIAVTAKGLSGGVYPIAAVMLSEDYAAWLQEDYAGFAGTYAGGELACAVGLAALELSTSEETLANVNKVAAIFGDGLKDLCTRYAWVRGVRQFGLLFAIEIDGEDAGLPLIKALYDRGVLTFPAANAGNVVNLKLGHLVDEAFCTEALGRIEAALKDYGESQ